MQSRRNFWETEPKTTCLCPGDIQVQLVNVSPESWVEGSCAEHIIAAAARTSFNNFDKTPSMTADKLLIRRLYRDRHTSPLEMASVTFQIRAPKFVTIQLLRHRTFHFNEESQRYHQIDKGYFHPSVDPERFIRVPHKDNKQSSQRDESTAADLKLQFEKIEHILDEVFELYDEAIKMGAAKECARFCLPMATWSTIVVSCDLHNLTHFLKLRLASDAQYEIQLVARAMYHLAKQAFPIVLEAFEEYTLTPEMSLDDSDFVYT